MRSKGFCLPFMFVVVSSACAQQESAIDWSTKVTIESGTVTIRGICNAIAFAGVNAQADPEVAEVTIEQSGGAYELGTLTGLLRRVLRLGVEEVEGVLMVLPKQLDPIEKARGIDPQRSAAIMRVVAPAVMGTPPPVKDSGRRKLLFLDQATRNEVLAVLERAKKIMGPDHGFPDPRQTPNLEVRVTSPLIIELTWFRRLSRHQLPGFVEEELYNRGAGSMLLVR